MTDQNGVGFVKLFVGDLDRAARFYADSLGMKPSSRIAAQAFDEQILRPANSRGASLVLCRWRDGRALDRGNAHGPIGFLVENVDAVAERVAAAGGRLHVAPMDFGDARVAFARDLDGHEIELLDPRANSATDS
jgi:lactoylglutathione lyase